MKKILTLVLILSNIVAVAEVRLAEIFGDNMVLQQQAEVSIWGWAKPNSTITITSTWSKNKVTAKVDNNGKFRLKLPTPIASKTPQQITFNDGTKLTINNILIGEVWLCSGQSNMEMPLKGYRNQPIEGSNMTIVKSRNDNIRLFTVPRFSKIELQDTMKRATQWKISEPEATANFSATGYFFGKMLYEILDIPVGLIVSSWGGSQVESWMREDMLTDFPEISIPKTESDIKESNRTPTTLFSGMINPILGYEIRGCIWYQGESNYERPDQYELLFPKMVKEWRKAWDIGEFPFYFAQIAPYNYAQLPPYNKGGKFNSAFLRDAQRKSELCIPNSAMVVLIDVGEENCIHPKHKKEVGERFALQALARIYGLKGFAYASPTFNEINISNDTVQVLFNNGKLGLTTFGKELTAFEIAGEDRKFYPAKAQIKYKKGAMVELTSTEVSKPIAVRYAFQDFIIGNLYSTEGLPVPSFRTDDWDE